MKYVIKHLTSFLLPFTVLVLVPWYIEPAISVNSLFAFLIGFLFILTGLTALVITIGYFFTSGKGTLAPWFPTGKLVVKGLYAYVRNPMISGVLTVLTGESIAFLSIKILVWALLFFVLNNLYFLIYEEPNLEKRFGDEYVEYKKNVPQWIPRLTPYVKTGDGSE